MHITENNKTGYTLVLLLSAVICSFMIFTMQHLLFLCFIMFFSIIMLLSIFLGTISPNSAFLIKRYCINIIITGIKKSVNEVLYKEQRYEKRTV